MGNIIEKNKLKDKLLIVGDIAGRFNELEALIYLAKTSFPELSIVSVGDMVDRGQQGRQVLEYFRTDPDAHAVLGNHEDMMRDYGENPQDPIYNRMWDWEMWLGNGGGDTLQGYPNQVISPGHIKYLKSLPNYIDHTVEDEGLPGGRTCRITHAPIHPDIEWVELVRFPADHDFSLQWNRRPPKRIPGVDMQFHGHNARSGVQIYSDDLGNYGCNVDTSFARVLTGMVWPDMVPFQVSYGDKLSDYLKSEESGENDDSI